MAKSRTRKKPQKSRRARRPEPTSEQMRAIVSVMLHSGLRTEEVHRLKWTDLDLDSDHPSINTSVVRATTPAAYEAIQHLEEELQAGLAVGGHLQQPMNEAATRDEHQQVRRFGTLVKPGLVWACDWPYHESGVNATGGQGYSLQVTPRGSEDRVVVARAADWEGLFAAASRAAADQPFWARLIGARQQVYDHAYAWRLAVGADALDAHDLALGAADCPFIGLDYFVGWLRANPQEVAANEAADAFVHGGRRKGLGLSGALAQALEHPIGLPPAARC